jgi:hypothetical protein
MPVVALLALEERGKRIPLARTKRPDVLRAVARAAVADVHAAWGDETDELVGALLKQEADRLERALLVLGLGSSGEGADG